MFYKVENIKRKKILAADSNWFMLLIYVVPKGIFGEGGDPPPSLQWLYTHLRETLYWMSH